MAVDRVTRSHENRAEDDYQKVRESPVSNVQLCSCSGERLLAEENAYLDLRKGSSATSQ
jgi:hypothetical protein